ncbi:OsmC family protein [Candidatus Profftella armatura (Diaphorina cf. continua)]|uniref:OsmC family protein n=1 Tax=Candidatus Profftella armatura (Diaphorina cf. continua) TaxID=2661583 RepID=A0A7R6W001_9PROT|nr:hypothetical protein [Candidatus Profftella armatura (Diaphorina cf. continua)]BCG49704.1 OsmC family protein [Candidatus Profftella armatura (Diaphorina cf. continua)]
MSFLEETNFGHLMIMYGVSEGGKLSIKTNRNDIVGNGVSKYLKVFIKIHFHFIIIEFKLKSNLLENAIKLLFEKYCSESFMLKNRKINIYF